MNEKSVNRRIMGKWTVTSLAHVIFTLLQVKQNINFFALIKLYYVIALEEKQGINSEKDGASPLL